MSSYNSNHSQNENQKPQDNSYFTFLAGILLLFVIYFAITIFKKIFYKVPFSDEKKYINCHCSKCKERYEILKLKIKSKNINIFFFFNIVNFLICLYLFIECCKQVQKNDKTRFDPFEILQISEGAPISEIKKSYKKLSLKYHPDKNQNDKDAKDKFININKAYRALTNEKAKENYKKYGNPDGPGVLEFGFALPFFLLKGKIGSYIITFFAILMTIIFPIIFIKWYKNSKKYNNDGLLMENLPFYYNILNKDILIYNLPFIIGMSKEFNEMNIGYDEEEIKKLFEIFIPYFPKDYNYENISLKNIFAISVIYIHYSNSLIIIQDKQSFEEYNRNKIKILEKAKFLIDQLIKIIFELNKIYEYNKGLDEFQQGNKNDINTKLIKTMLDKGKIDFYPIKDFDFNLIKMILSFRSRIFHETDIKLDNNELMLFPNNKSNIKIFEKYKYSSLYNLKNIISNPRPKKDQWLQKLENLDDIKEIISLIPKYELYPELINTRYEVGNLLTFNISITRGDKNKINSNEEQKELGFLHSNNYFNYYNEEIMIIIIDKDKNRVNYHEKVKFEYLNEEKKIEYSMLVENNGKNNFGIYLFSISYPGIVINKDMSIEIKEENNLLNNFIKNREKEVLSLEEFEESYGILNNDRIEGNEKREIHDHED